MNKIEKKLLFKMLRIRNIEQAIADNYKFQKMRCPVHLSIGQEAPAVGVMENLTKNDKIVTAHRSHAHYLAKGGNLKSMIAELHGKSSGCAKGKGGSMHLIDLEAGVSAAVPIVGSTIPIGVGLSWNMKLKKMKNIVVIFFGDGATEEGVFLESLDFASLHSLPVLFVCENNHFSVYSPLSNRQSKKRDIIKVAKAVGINGSKIHGNDVSNIYKKSKKIINNIKQNSKPYILLLDTFRHLEHCGPNNDNHLNYRSNDYIQKWLDNCPIETLKKKLLTKKFITHTQIKNYENKISNEIKFAFKYAYISKFPEKKYLSKNIYA